MFFKKKKTFLTHVIKTEIERIDVQPGYPTWSEINEKGLPKEAGAGHATWCNRAAIRILDKLGYNTDPILNVNPYNSKPDLAWTSANAMVRLAKADSKIWRVPERVAQGLANMGVGILIGAEGKGKSGHVGIVAPHEWNKIMGAFIGQAGGFNGFYFQRDKRSFNVKGIEKPSYFILRRKKDDNLKETLRIAYQAYIG